ncbi:hypothetical protein HHI36_002926 [Cryptolaemus montrouzieri]|uniref:Protein regulator of cytokinesis 1 n=1 Tax=Cryptolaemus montrouzieri TaxID=559131 RepID=A0ABD2PBW0_9CUCU
MEMENLDLNIIEGHEWAQELRKSLHDITDRGFLNWCQIVLELGENEVELEKWIGIFKGQIEERFKELWVDVMDMKAKVIDSITELLQTTQNYARELGSGENLLDINPDDKYYRVQKDLLKRAERLEKIVQERRQTLNELLEKQTALCTLLEKPPISLQTSPLPSNDNIEKLQQYIDDLEQEKFNREECYIQLKQSIIEMSKQLDMVPKSDFERNILSDNKTNFDISKSNMAHLQKYHDNMDKQLKSMREEIDQLRKTVDDLWTILEESITERDSFHDRNPGYSISTLKALRDEVKRCENLKKANIKVFVEKLRTELHSLWKMCYHLNQEDLSDFPWFTSDFYTEDLLHYHEIEINKWRSFYCQNEELIKLFAEHEKLWNNLLQMENKDNDGLNRYKNRGGQLLREEKERNKLSKKIPQIEEKLRSLAFDYEEYHGSSFQIFGTPILEYIDNLHLQRDQNRKIKLSAKKQKLQDVTPAKSCLSLFPSSSRLVTPGTGGSTIKRKLIKPQTTSKKARIDTPKQCGKIHFFMYFNLYF